MDGNGRWARKRGLPRIAGHSAGVEAVRRAVEVCARKGIEVLTLFAFSSENWRRPKQEVGLLMELFMTSLQQEVQELRDNGVRLRFIGDRHAFSAQLQDSIDAAQRLTAANQGLTLVVAVDYGGRWDITEAIRKIARHVACGDVVPEEITPELVRSYISLNDLPDPDLFIRTGGERRISNYLLWHLAYTELYFTECLWPDFGPQQFEASLAWFCTRQRRFGQTSEQVEQSEGA
ncbi:MAG: polyprenyl diphosphate synthase [Gammaproteobacteria bacterium]|nr:polyprenyl diphosphate synthase [Gammaproteobacteria bacterium]